MMVGLATATMVASTMIMKKPIIIAHSAFQGFVECDRFDGMVNFQRLVGSARLGPARWVPPAHLGVAVVMHSPRFSSRRCSPVLLAPITPEWSTGVPA